VLDINIAAPLLRFCSGGNQLAHCMKLFDSTAVPPGGLEKWASCAIEATVRLP
jgi:hypothetical protein